MGLEEFQEVVQEVLPSSSRLRQGEISLLYKCFDRNTNGFLELGDLTRLHRHLDGEVLR